MRLLFLSIFCLIFFGCVPLEKKYDVLLSNGTIVDGLGNPRYQGNIAIKNDRIALISKEAISNKQAHIVIDIKGKIISPGFIDPHAHIQTKIHQFPQPENFLRQGITTICASLHSGDLSLIHI